MRRTASPSWHPMVCLNRKIVGSDGCSAHVTPATLLQYNARRHTLWDRATRFPFLPNGEMYELIVGARLNNRELHI